MSFNFPNNPALNQVFVASGNVAYRWDGEVWQASGPAVSNEDLLNGHPGPYYLDRVNHTGEQGMWTVSGLEAALADKAPLFHGHAISDITSLQPALDGKAPIDSPVLTGDPRAPTPLPGDNDTSIATTAFVRNAVLTSGSIVVDAPDSQNYVRTLGAWVLGYTKAAIDTLLGAKAPKTAEARNRIVNGAMQISQENANTAGTTHGFYAADQWLLLHVGTTAAISLQRVQLITPNKSINRLRYSVTTGQPSLAAGDYSSITQRIEGSVVADFGWGAASARPVVLSFGFKAPAGTYHVSLRNSAQTYIFSCAVVISAGQANTDTAQSFVVPGSTAGPWLIDSGIGMELVVNIAAGTTHAAGAAGAWRNSGVVSAAGQTNGVATAGNVFELFDVGLYLDPSNTGLAPPWQMPGEAEELRACQRYFRKYGGVQAYDFVAQGQAFSTTTGYITWAFNPPMRVSPAFAASGAWAVYGAAGAITALTNHTQGGVSPTPTTNLTAITTASGLAANQAITLFANADAAATIKYSARM